MYKRILVCLENSSTDAHIVEHIGPLAKLCGATILLRLIDRFPAIVWVGSVLIVYVAVELILKDPLIHDRLPEALEPVWVHRVLGIIVGVVLVAFVVLAPDVFWRSARRVDLGYEGADRQRGIELMGQAKAAELESDIVAAVTALRGRAEVAGSKVGAIGYCMGGRLAFVAAASAGVDAAVAYYGGGIHNILDKAAGIRCPVQFHYAEHDAYLPVEPHDARDDAR